MKSFCSIHESAASSMDLGSFYKQLSLRCPDKSAEQPNKHSSNQGKHKAQQSSTRSYSPDDVHGALQFQTSIVEAVRSGFRPTTPLGRGGQHPMEEPKFQLQLFSKTASDHVWQYFNFTAQPEIPPDPTDLLAEICITYSHIPQYQCTA